MGNCQAIDAAALVIQYPSGRLERMYWPVSASEVMRMNPGHYVSLIIPLPNSQEEEEEENKKKNDQKTVRFTRVKLLRPTDTLDLGHAYRLVTSQEVMKVLRAKRNAKLKKNQPESGEKQASADGAEPAGIPELRNSDQVIKHERHRMRMAATNPVAARLKSWRPSLQSISEASS